MKKKQYALMCTFIIGKDYSQEDAEKIRKAGFRAGRKQAKREHDALMRFLKSKPRKSA